MAKKNSKMCIRDSHESIQNAYQSRALSGKVLKVEHLESAQAGSAQAVFNVSLVADVYKRQELCRTCLEPGEVHSPHGTDKAYRSPYTDGRLSLIHI